MSGTVGEQAWSIQYSSTVNAESRPVVRDGDKTEMNGDKKAQETAAKKARYKCRKEANPSRRAEPGPRHPGRRRRL